MDEGTPNFFKSTVISVALVMVVCAIELRVTCTEAPAVLEDSLTAAGAGIGSGSSPCHLRYHHR